MEHHGHAVAGMTNQIVWGLPRLRDLPDRRRLGRAHLASASASVFGNKAYKPMARFSSLLVITLLVGGLAIVVLDLSRADRLIVAMTTYNFKSIFACGTVATITASSPWSRSTRAADVSPARLQMGQARRPRRPVAACALAWATVLRRLVARPGYDAAIVAPMFIIMSFSFGLAVFVDADDTAAAQRSPDRRPASDAPRPAPRGLRRHGFYFGAGHPPLGVSTAPRTPAATGRWFMCSGIYTLLFWGVQVIIGIVGVALVFSTRRRLDRPRLDPRGDRRFRPDLRTDRHRRSNHPSAATIPGYEVLEGFHEGVVNPHHAVDLGLMLGLGGVALALFARPVSGRRSRAGPADEPVRRQPRRKRPDRARVNEGVMALDATGCTP
ncbi:MAG: NrfD/PsrC family molybdoenzyme membrane anchor subunit [Paracoccaceae bacterium]